MIWFFGAGLGGDNELWHHGCPGMLAMKLKGDLTKPICISATMRGAMAARVLAQKPLL